MIMEKRQRNSYGRLELEYLRGNADDVSCRHPCNLTYSKAEIMQFVSGTSVRFGNFRQSIPSHSLLSICIHCRTEEDARVELTWKWEKVLSVRIAYETQEPTGSRMVPDVRGAFLEMW